MRQGFAEATLTYSHLEYRLVATPRRPSREHLAEMLRQIENAMAVKLKHEGKDGPA